MRHRVDLSTARRRDDAHLSPAFPSRKKSARVTRRPRARVCGFHLCAPEISGFRDGFDGRRRRGTARRSRAYISVWLGLLYGYSIVVIVVIVAFGFF